MELNEQLKQALVELRKDSKARKFNQSVDLIMNLQKYDIKKNKNCIMAYDGNRNFIIFINY